MARKLDFDKEAFKKEVVNNVKTLYRKTIDDATKHTTTDKYLISYKLANIHRIIRTISFAAYANAKYGLLLKVKYTARKLVVTEIVLRNIFAVLQYSNIK